MGIDCTIIIVSWNVKDLLARCLVSLQGSRGVCILFPGQSPAQTAANGVWLVEVIVIDNASQDGTPGMLQDFPWVRCHLSSDNLGFTGGNNLGISLARGACAFLLNPDTEVEPEAIQALLHSMAHHPDWAVAGPSLRYPDGQLQGSRYRFPDLLIALTESTPFQWWVGDHALSRRYHLAGQPIDCAQDVDWVNGAALLIRRKIWQSVGVLDTGFFMYSEEMDWCYRIKAAGWRVGYEPAAQITHHEGQSSGQVTGWRHQVFNRSKLHFFARHHTRWETQTLRWGILLQYALALVEESFKWSLGHKRPLRAARVRAYWDLLASGLT
ncbi:MAG: glycosyltransferase family 2 protein [Chloroflexi bacterium]|nr:glycosyltransferase family 2 protein [Chloroflexota bacterium]